MFKLNLQISRIAYQLPLAPKAQHETIGAGVPTCWTSIQSYGVLYRSSFRTTPAQEGGERQELLLRALRVVRTSCCVCYLEPCIPFLAGSADWRHGGAARQAQELTERRMALACFCVCLCIGLLLRMMCVTEMRVAICECASSSHRQ